MFLTKGASRYWGCRQDDHLQEELIRRFCNASTAAIRLVQGSYVDESPALVRVGAEIANLVQLFVLDQDRMELWREASETELRQAWSPFSVRRPIEDLGDSALIDRDAHAALCAFGVHLSAPALDLTYNLQPRVQIGPSNFAIPGLFLVLKELAFLHSGVLRLVVGFLTVPTSEQTTAESISRSLSGAMGSVRATNYREEIARLSAVGSTASREQSESISAVPGKNRRRRNKSPFQRWRKFRRSAIGSDDHPEVDIHRLLRTTAQELHKELTEHR